MMKWLVLAVACFALYRLFMNDRKKKNEAEQKAEAKQAADGSLVKDPECGTYVDPESSISVRNGDSVVHFCSYECRQKYLDKLGLGKGKDEAD